MSGTRILKGLCQAVQIAKGEIGPARLHDPSRKIVQACAFDLPVPLSVNALHMPGKQGGIIRTPAYRNWLTEAGYQINRQAKERVAGSYGMILTVTNKSRADLGNCEKAVSDLLQDHGIIENDRLCTSIQVTWGAVDGMRVQIMSSKPRDETREAKPLFGEVAA